MTPKTHHPAFTQDNEVVSTLRDLGRAYGQTFVLETLAALEWERPATSPILHEQLREVLDLLHDRQRPSIKLECLRLACGMESVNYGEVGIRFGVSREAVRQHVTRFRLALGLPPCGTAMSDRQRRLYASNGRKPATHAIGGVGRG